MGIASAIAVSSPVTVSAGATWDLNGKRPDRGSSERVGNDRDRRVQSDQHLRGQHVFFGFVAGHGTFVKDGAGTLTFDGTFSNTFNGPISVLSGALTLTGQATTASPGT